MNIVVNEINNVISVTEQTVSVVAPSDDTVTIVTAGIQGIPGISSTAGADEYYTAGQILSGHRVVVLDSSGKAFYATADDITHAGRILGLTLNAASVDGQAAIRIVGKVTETGWSWTPSQPVFLGLNGQLTQNPSLAGLKFIQIIGFAITPQIIMVNIEQPIKLLEV